MSRCAPALALHVQRAIAAVQAKPAPGRLAPPPLPRPSSAAQPQPVPVTTRHPAAHVQSAVQACLSRSPHPMAVSPARGAVPPPRPPAPLPVQLKPASPPLPPRPASHVQAAVAAGRTAVAPRSAQARPAPGATPLARPPLPRAPLPPAVRPALAPAPPAAVQPMISEKGKKAGFVALDQAYRLMSEDDLVKVWDVRSHLHHDLYMKNSLLAGTEDALYEDETVDKLNSLLKQFEGAFVIANPVMRELVGDARESLGLGLDDHNPYTQYPKLRQKTNKVVATWDDYVDFEKEYSVPYELHHLIPRAYQREASIADENFVLATRGSGKRGEVGSHEGLFHMLLSAGTGSLFSTVVPGSAGYFKRLIAAAQSYDLTKPSSLPTGYEWLELRDFSKMKPLPKKKDLELKMKRKLEDLLERSEVVSYEPRSILIDDLFTDPLEQLKVWKSIKTEIFGGPSHLTLTASPKILKQKKTKKTKKKVPVKNKK